MQKTGGPFENMSFSEKPFDDSRREKTTLLAQTKQPREALGPQRQQLTTDFETRKKQTEGKMKKSFRLKLSDICKTRNKKSSLGMFNFYLVLVDRDMVSDTARLPDVGVKSKSHHCQQKV